MLYSRDLPNTGMEPRSPVRQADSLPSEPPGKPKIYPKNLQIDNIPTWECVFNLVRVRFNSKKSYKMNSLCKKKK